MNEHSLVDLDIASFGDEIVARSVLLWLSFWTRQFQKMC